MMMMMIKANFHIFLSKCFRRNLLGEDSDDSFFESPKHQTGKMTVSKFGFSASAVDLIVGPYV